MYIFYKLQKGHINLQSNYIYIYTLNSTVNVGRWMLQLLMFAILPQPFGSHYQTLVSAPLSLLLTLVTRATAHSRMRETRLCLPVVRHCPEHRRRPAPPQPGASLPFAPSRLQDGCWCAVGQSLRLWTRTLVRLRPSTITVAISSPL
jgi:hypothetical protein